MTDEERADAIGALDLLATGAAPKSYAPRHRGRWLLEHARPTEAEAWLALREDLQPIENSVRRLQAAGYSVEPVPDELASGERYKVRCDDCGRFAKGGTWADIYDHAGMQLDRQHVRCSDCTRRLGAVQTNAQPSDGNLKPYRGRF